MPVLHLDNVPEDLYRRLENLATTERVPLAEETVKLLQRAVDLRIHILQMLEQVWRDRITPSPGDADSVELLREDRNR